MRSVSTDRGPSAFLACSLLSHQRSPEAPRSSKREVTGGGLCILQSSGGIHISQHRKLSFWASHICPHWPTPPPAHTRGAAWGAVWACITLSWCPARGHRARGLHTRIAAPGAPWGGLRPHGASSPQNPALDRGTGAAKQSRQRPWRQTGLNRC